MNNFLDVLKTIYTKEKIEIIDSVGDNIALTRSLSKNTENLKVLKKIDQYLFTIEPLYYFFLLYFLIKKVNYIPRSIKINKKEESSSLLIEKIKTVLGWSNKELNLNKYILEKTILIEEKFWKSELGIK